MVLSLNLLALSRAFAVQLLLTKPSTGDNLDPFTRLENSTKLRLCRLGLSRRARLFITEGALGNSQLPRPKRIATIFRARFLV
jgi:hypothetical protein